MKHYNTNFIKNYIEQHKDDIDSVYCGMKEDWHWTADKIFENGKYSDDFDWKSEHISVCGISGSTWATPVMEVSFKDGRTEIVNCYEDDGEQVSTYQIAQQKMFAVMTGGMDMLGG